MARKRMSRNKKGSTQDFLDQYLTTGDQQAKAKGNIGYLWDWRESNVAVAVHFLDGISKQTVENGQRRADGTPKVISFARLCDGWEEGMKRRSTLVLCQIQNGFVAIELGRWTAGIFANGIGIRTMKVATGFSNAFCVLSSASLIAPQNRLDNHFEIPAITGIDQRNQYFRQIWVVPNGGVESL